LPSINGKGLAAAAQGAQFPSLLIKDSLSILTKNNWINLELISEYVSINFMANSESETNPEGDFATTLTDAEKLSMLQEAILSCQESMSHMQDERDAFLIQLQRSQADFENYKKRAKKDQDIAVQGVTRKFLEKLIPIMDNIDYALNAVGPDQESLAKPIRMISEAFSRTLSEYSVTRIFPQPGEPFNPEIHQAISVMYADVDAQVIGHVARTGYAIGSQVFRPSDVVVHKPNE
jgi:molecular chaperone GrpE